MWAKITVDMINYFSQTAAFIQKFGCKISIVGLLKLIKK